MKQREYHYFLSGLPEISFEDPAPPIKPHEFIDTLSFELDPEDFEMVRLLLLKQDHKNLVNFIMGREAEYTGVEMFKEEDFKRQMENFDAILPEEDILPPYMVNVLSDYFTRETEPDETAFIRKIDEGYYQWVVEKGNDFLRAYTDFEYNLSNILSYRINIRTSAEASEGIQKTGSFARQLEESAGKNAVKDTEFDYFDDILKIEESMKFASAEREYDKLRWNVIENLTLFEYFTVNSVLAYLEKSLLLSRWENMTPAAGNEKMNESINKALGNKLDPVENGQLIK